MKTKFEKLLFGSKKVRFLIYIPQLTVALFLSFHFDSERSDFRLFHSSSREMLKQISPWDINIHEYGNAYLNDPITLWFLSPLSLFQYESALTIFRIINIAIALVLLNFLIKRTELHIAVLTSIFFLTTVALRSNLEYGALGFIAFSLWIFAINLIKNETNLVLAGALLAYTSMFKPQLYFINLAVLLFAHRKVKFAFIGTIAFSITFTSLFLNRLILIDWYEAIKLRALIAQSDNLQMDFACLLRILGINPNVATLVYLSLVSVVLVYVLRRNLFLQLLHSPEKLLLIATALSIFLHPTDLSVAAYICVLLFLSRSHMNIVGLLAVSMLNVWSNNYIFAIITTGLTFLLYLSTSGYKSRRSVLSVLLISSIPVHFVTIIALIPNQENFLRNLFNYLGLSILTWIILKRNDYVIPKPF